MKTLCVVAGCVWLAVSPAHMDKGTEKVGRVSPGDPNLCSLLSTFPISTPQHVSGQTGDTVRLTPAMMAMAVGAGDSANDAGTGSYNYLDVALEMCLDGCTDPFRIGLASAFSLVYGQAGELYGAYAGGCAMGCIGSWAYNSLQ